MNKRVFCLLLAVVAVPLGAQAQWKATLFSAPVAVSSGIDEVPGPGDSLVREQSMLISPFSPSFSKATARSTFAFAYHPEIEFVRGSDHQNWWNHYLEAAYRHSLGKRTRLDIASAFVKNSDPARLFIENIFVLPRNNFRELATAVTVNHELGRRTTMGFRFDNTVTRIDTAEIVGRTLLDQYGFAGTASVSRHLSERQKVTFSYSALEFSPYEFLTSRDAISFLGNVPTLRAGISRFAFELALSAAESSATPNGMASGGKLGTPAGIDGGVPDPILPPASSGGGGTQSSAVTTSPTPSVTPTPTVAGGLPLPGAGVIPTAAALPVPTAPLVGVTPVPNPRPDKNCKNKKCSNGNSSGNSLLGDEETPFTLAATPAGPPAFVEVGTNGRASMLGDLYHVASATYSNTRGQAFTFHLTGGVMGDHKLGYIVGTEIERRFDRLWAGVGLEHYLARYSPMPTPTATQASLPPEFIALPRDVTPRSLFTAATFRIGGNITRSLELEFSGSLSGSTANFVKHTVHTTIGRARVAYWITDRFGLFAVGDAFKENRHEALNTYYLRHRYFGGVQVRVSQPPRRPVHVSR